MKLLGLVMQNKKGETILMVSAPSFPTRSCAMYSHMIYQHILEVYRNRLKIERTISLEENLFCICNITKDYILYIFTNRQDITLAIDGIRKVNEYFNKGASSISSAKIDLVLKKPVQVRMGNTGKFISVFEEFLYTRQIMFRDFMSMKHPSSSRKKSVDDEIFNKFSHIGNDNDKNTIFTLQVKSGQVEALETKKKIKAIENSEKFVIKSQDQIFLLDVDPEKENFLNKYRKSIFKLAMGKSTREKARSDSINLENAQSPTLVQTEMQESFSLDQSKMQASVEKKEPRNLGKGSLFEKEKGERGEKMRLKVREKLSLELKNDKVKEVYQHGQIIVEGMQAHEARIVLVNEKVWNNPKLVSKRITPNSIPCKMISELEYEIRTPEGFKSKSVIDYVLRTETFSPEKIPLLFIYNMDINSSNVEFTFKYKLNEKWKHKISDLEITVYLNKDFVVLDCKTIPVAHSLKHNQVVWKTKEISPGSSNSKGKILLAFGQAKFPPKSILSEIRLSMRSSCGLMESLGVVCRQPDLQQEFTPERLLLINYKIHP